jgi:hypothetical protein
LQGPRKMINAEVITADPEFKAVAQEIKIDRLK